MIRISPRWQSELRPLFALLGLFLLIGLVPLQLPALQSAVQEGLELLQWYAREHILLCLLPAFLIAGAVSVAVRKDAILRTLGPDAPRWLAYGVASVSGSVLAVCSCTILPLFAGIHKRGAGLGPASAFLYAGPAINVLAILMTARILGWELGLARAVGAILFSIVIGLAMARLFPEDPPAEAQAVPVAAAQDSGSEAGRGLRLVAVLLLILVFANWSTAAAPESFFGRVASWRWPLTGLSALALGGVLWRDFQVSLLPLLGGSGVLLLAAVLLHPVYLFALGLLLLVVLLLVRGGEAEDWLEESWTYARQILPLLALGVFVAGLLLGRPGHEGLLPSRWIAAAVGGESLGANLLSALAGALMYFATLTEIPILQGLLGAGMGKGPALALLLAGPALSLPNMLVIRAVIGTRRTLAFVSLVVLLSALAGWCYGTIL